MSAAGVCLWHALVCCFSVMLLAFAASPARGEGPTAHVSKDWDTIFTYVCYICIMRIIMSTINPARFCCPGCSS